MQPLVAILRISLPAFEKKVEINVWEELDLEKGKISHFPQKLLTPKDMENRANVLLQTILAIDKN